MVSNVWPGDDGVLRTEVLERLEGAGRRGAEESMLAQRLERAPDRHALRAALVELERQGLVVEIDRRWLSVRHTNLVAGSLRLLERGDALVRTGAADEAGYFVPRRRLRGARDGDTVLIRRLGKRAALGRLPEAAVERVVERRARAVVGTLENEDGRGWRLVPFDPRLDLEVEVERGEGVPEGHYVVVEVGESHPSRPGSARGRVLEVLGSVDDPGVDARVILRHHDIPERFPPAALAAAADYPPDPAKADWAGRREDLRDQPIATIDGETARDFDDAISVERTRDGGFRLGVHIADVAHYVREGSAIDLEAYRRGTSVYYPELTIPMLPESLSAGLCSLRPGVPRLTVSAVLDFDADGRLVARRFAETVIRSQRRLTYDKARRLLEEPRAGDREEYGPVLTMLGHARELMTLLLRLRMDRGSIDFDLPEGDVILDTDGFVVGIRPGARHIAHRIIEEFMIAANEAVALELSTQDCPALFRVHEAPDRGKLEELRQILRGLGIGLKGNLESLHPRALQKVLSRVEGRPEEEFVSALVLRSMQRAIYRPECLGHYALSSRYYTHFTSPIRRYPDLVVHRRLKALLHHRAAEEAARTELKPRLPPIAAHASWTERRAERSERDLLQWKKVRFLADRVGERFCGRITGVQPFGLFVQLDDYFVDGLVPIRTMSDDYYLFEPESHRLVGERSGRCFRLADPVEVVLSALNERERGLELRLAGMPQTPESRPRRPARMRRR